MYLERNDMDQLCVRRQTFMLWPGWAPRSVQRDHLAEAGFYYTGGRTRSAATPVARRLPAGKTATFPSTFIDVAVQPVTWSSPSTKNTRGHRKHCRHRRRPSTTRRCPSSCLLTSRSMDPLGRLHRRTVSTSTRDKRTAQAH